MDSLSHACTRGDSLGINQSSGKHEGTLRAYRSPYLHTEGHWFESITAHHRCLDTNSHHSYLYSL
jgi:hypothetical protein